MQYNKNWNGKAHAVDQTLNEGMAWDGARMRLFTILVVLFVSSLVVAIQVLSENKLDTGLGPQAPIWLFAGLFALGLAVVEGGRRAFIGPR